MKRLPLVGFLLLVGCTADPQPPPPAPQSATAAPALAELCETHQSDKCAQHHEYVDLYEVFLDPVRDRTERLLEIGVAQGDSMRLWEEYFPNARVFGIDIYDSSQYDTDRIVTFVADQADREQLGAFIETHGSAFDVVIDDGGHGMEQQQVSFGFLFPHVRPGGMYVIEDIHTSFPHLYPGYDVDEDESNSTFSMFVDFVRDGEFESPYLDDQELAYLNAHVEHCLYSYRDNAFHSDFILCEKK